MNQETSSIKLECMQLARCNFYAFVEHCYPSYIENMSTIDKERTLVNNFTIATMRGIMDSMYNEFLYYRNPLHISKFPDFMYS